mgnify:CR=1 FL=1
MTRLSFATRQTCSAKQVSRCLQTVGVEVVALNDGRQALDYLRKLVDEGKLKVVGVLSSERQAMFKKAPTLNESKALKGFVFEMWSGYFVRKDTPEPVVQALHKALSEVANDPTVRSALEAQAMTVPRPQSLAAVGKVYADNTAKYQAMTKAMLYWIKTADVDGFRCDVASLLPLSGTFSSPKNLSHITLSLKLVGRARMAQKPPMAMSSIRASTPPVMTRSAARWAGVGVSGSTPDRPSSSRPPDGVRRLTSAMAANSRNSSRRVSSEFGFMMGSCYLSA